MTARKLNVTLHVESPSPPWFGVAAALRVDEGAVPRLGVPVAGQGFRLEAVGAGRDQGPLEAQHEAPEDRGQGGRVQETHQVAKRARNRLA